MEWSSLKREGKKNPNLDKSTIYVFEMFFVPLPEILIPELNKYIYFA